MKTISKQNIENIKRFRYWIELKCPCGQIYVKLSREQPYPKSPCCGRKLKEIFRLL